MKRYLVGILTGGALVAAGFFAVQHRHSSTHATIAPEQRLVQITEQLDAAMTKTANDTTVLPEVRVDALASKAKVDAMFALDARLGTSETQVYSQQEAEHWQRVSQALRHPHPKAAQPWQIEWKESSDIRLDESINDPRALPESRADTAAAKLKFDALFALDALLGTDETSIFLRQETDRSNRIVAAMEGLNK
jgi:hypothetical protein